MKSKNTIALSKEIIRKHESDITITEIDSMHGKWTSIINSIVMEKQAKETCVAKNENMLTK